MVWQSPLAELSIEAELLFAAIAVEPTLLQRPLAAGQVTAPPRLSVELVEKH